MRLFGRFHRPFARFWNLQPTLPANVLECRRGAGLQPELFVRIIKLFT
jgi:hypothetical protein